jgi:hypothetical protein
VRGDSARVASRGDGARGDAAARRASNADDTRVGGGGGGFDATAKS